MQLTTHGSISPARVTELSAWLDGQTTTERVVHAVLDAGYPLLHTHEMDEFTIDIVVGLPDGLVLVYDTT